ncbi:hypothetical protein Pmani_024865 [Petrolisthes manimaculis]|uniref:Uncharacterized protein n=1 Tax=Petrolisthes manimaculis TaxID=1843537 RepID=A0AAE1P7U7_9EUCA|nr:hypothetical protein Pmani_024865 [Petrolisthes manimaculis]
MEEARPRKRGRYKRVVEGRGRKAPDPCEVIKNSSINSRPSGPEKRGCGEGEEETWREGEKKKKMENKSGRVEGDTRSGREN